MPSRSYSDLTALMNEPLNLTEWIHTIAASGHDMADHRAASIVLATQVEDSLQLAIMNRMIELSNEDINRLFGPYTPLGLFDAKIKIGFAFGIFDREVWSNLDRIRTTRNAFAHTGRQISFDTPAIADQCRKLSCDPAIQDPKKRFQTSCLDLIQKFLESAHDEASENEPE